MIQKTFQAKEKEVDKKYYLIDATNKILGKVATKAAIILRGKNKRIYTPHVDTGDYVIIVNAEKIKVTGKKLQQKEYQRYSGYHGGQKAVRLDVMLAKKPTQVLRLAVNRMIPKGPLGNRIKKKLKIYAGSEHPHQSQKPITLEV